MCQPDILELFKKNPGVQFSANEIAFHLNESVDKIRRKMVGLRKGKLVKYTQQRHFAVKKYFVYHI